MEKIEIFYRVESVMKSGLLIALLWFSNAGCNREPEFTGAVPVVTPVTLNEPAPESKSIVLDDNDPARLVADDTKYKLLCPGVFIRPSDGTDYRAKDGDIWFGLFKSGDQMTLRKSRLAVKRIRDVHFKLLKVSIVGKEQPLYLFKGPGFREGNVQVFFSLPNSDNYKNETPEAGNLDERFLQKLSFGGSEYMFRGDHATMHMFWSDHSPMPDRLNVPVLVIESPTGNQIVLGTWLDLIGDLDNDGKPDVLVSDERDGIAEPVLYLSSEARPSKLVQAVAAMEIWGD